MRKTSSREGKVLWGTKVPRGTKFLCETNVLQETKVPWETKVRGTKVLWRTKVWRSKVRGTKVRLGTKVWEQKSSTDQKSRNKRPGNKSASAVCGHTVML